MSTVIRFGKKVSVAPGPPLPRPTRRTLYGLAAVADVSLRSARAALNVGLLAVPERDRSRIVAGARAIGLEILDEIDLASQPSYRDIKPVDAT